MAADGSVHSSVVPRKTSSLLLSGEIVSATHFQEENLSVYFHLQVDGGWQPLSPVSWMTHTSRAATVGTNNVCCLAHPFEVRLERRNTEDVLGSVGKLLIQVVSRDRWGSYSVQGYASCNVPAEPGSFTLLLRTWRPSSRNATLQHYFMGRHTTPLDVKMHGSYGSSIESGGTVSARISIVYQGVPRKATFFDAAIARDNQASIKEVLASFHRARSKMLAELSHFT
ncbi:tectonic-like complex member MKS1 [Ornithodoros turicata]|uniref:tectonic-like complex member MKS1 n=1 Tax=Ornithodoros turicata TaxID=34597 RepID=UPI00313A1D08